MVQKPQIDASQVREMFKMFYGNKWGEEKYYNAKMDMVRYSQTENRVIHQLPKGGPALACCRKHVGNRVYELWWEFA